MEDEFINRIRNRIKQKEGNIKEYEKVLRRYKKGDLKISQEIVNEEIVKIQRVVIELINIIRIYEEVKKMKGGLK